MRTGTCGRDAWAEKERLTVFWEGGVRGANVASSLNVLLAT